jgi:predicted solute-binding protein
MATSDKQPLLLFDDSPTIAPLALALELGWATLPIPVRTVAGLRASTVREHPGALAFLPLAEYADLQDDYAIVPDLAAGGQHDAATILVADRRLDEVDDPIVDLGASSRTTELLTRATLLKFYGITAAAWTRDGDDLPEGPEGRQTIEIRDGGEALHLLDTPGDRVISDLGRAWFILTGFPPVTHLLVAPTDSLDASWLKETLTALPAALAEAHERRRELRRTLAERYGVSRDLLNTFYNDQFLSLTGDAQKSILALFPAGAWGMDLPNVSRLNLAPWARRA